MSFFTVPVRLGNRTYRVRVFKIWLKNGKLNSPVPAVESVYLFFGFTIILNFTIVARSITQEEERGYRCMKKKRILYLGII